MKNILVIGSSPAAIKASEEIRKQDPGCEIVVLAEQDGLPVRRDRICDFLAGEISDKELALYPENFYQQQQIKLIRDDRLNRINFTRKYAVTDNKAKWPYDAVIIAGAASTDLSSVKGSNKSGVFGINGGDEVREMKKAIALAETVVIESDTIEGLALVKAVRQKAKEVIWVVPGDFPLSFRLNQDTAAAMTRILGEHGIRVISDNGIKEVLGDNEAKAIRLSSGKVIACDTIVFADARPDWKKFKDTDLPVRDGCLEVDFAFRTKLDSVFAVGESCRVRQDDRVLSVSSFIPDWDRQGVVLAGSVCGAEAVYLPSCASYSFTFGENQLDCLFGNGPLQGDVQEFLESGESKVRFQRIWIDGQKISGAVLLNAGEQREKIWEWVRGQVDISELGEELLAGADQEEDRDSDNPEENSSDPAPASETCESPERALTGSSETDDILPERGGE